MYYPILRGKQFELIALRELSPLIAASKFCPLIEPVRKNLKPLITTLGELAKHKVKPAIIINPNLGDFIGSGTDLFDELHSAAPNQFTPCLKINSSNDFAITRLQELKPNVAAFIENGVDKALISAIEGTSLVFANKDKLVPGALALIKNLVPYRNSFIKQARNADYSNRSSFSNLHLEYQTIPNAIGFGDFTILSEEYSESGGPAYVVTIHLSYIDNEEFNSMYIRHFSSYDDESPTNPGGKYKDALKKLLSHVRAHENTFYKSSGLNGFFSLEGKEFPGLGQVKKLSIKHHIETTCDYIKD